MAVSKRLAAEGDNTTSKSSRRSRKRKAKAKTPVPIYERDGVRKFAVDCDITPVGPLPTVTASGEVKRAPRKFNVVRRRDAREQDPEHVPPEPAAPVVVSEPAKKRARKEGKEEPMTRVRERLAGWAARVVSAPEENVGILRELRQFSASHKGRAAALSILTEAQVFKDLAPAYRIRAITEQEANVKVSKEVAKLRAYEQALSAAYTRYVRSICTLSRWRTSATAKVTKATDQMLRGRQAACTSLSELLKALPHFNQAETIVASVCALTTDNDEAVRKEAAGALRSVLAQAHRAAGPTLATCVTIASTLSKAATQRTVSGETIEPMLGIKFASFPLLPIGKRIDKKRGNYKGKHQKVNQRNAAKAAKEESAKMQLDREMETDVLRDLREADAEASPQELLAARKAMLDAVCRALFKVIHSASVNAESAQVGGRTKKPPPALAPALHALRGVAEYISIDIVEAILAALNPLLESTRLPLAMRLRCVGAAYAILAHHARSSGATEDSVAADASGMDRTLYAALDALYDTQSTTEKGTIEFIRALAAALAFREMPVARAAAFARRVAIGAAALAPTHTVTIALLAATQFIAPKRIVSCIFAGAVQDDYLQNFDTTFEDPDATAAHNSGMWELAALVCHFHPAARGVAKSMAKSSVEPALAGSVSHVPALLKQYSSEGGGFNPPPQTEWKGKNGKRTNPQSQQQLLKSMGFAADQVEAPEDIELDVNVGVFHMKSSI